MWQNSTVFPLSVINNGSHLSLRQAIHNKKWKIDEHINYEWALCGEFDSSNFDVLSYESQQYSGVLQFSLVVVLALTTVKNHLRFITDNWMWSLQREILTIYNNSS